MLSASKQSESAIPIHLLSGKMEPKSIVSRKTNKQVKYITCCGPFRMTNYILLDTTIHREYIPGKFHECQIHEYQGIVSMGKGDRFPAVHDS